MKKIIKILPLCLSIVCLASCGSSSSSVEEPSSTVTEDSSISSSEESGSSVSSEADPNVLTQDMFTPLIDGYSFTSLYTEVYDFGSDGVSSLYYRLDAECTAKGYHYKQSNYSATANPTFDSEGILYQGNFEPYTVGGYAFVSDSTLLINNTVSSYSYQDDNVLWEDTFDNFFAYLDVDDFVETSTGVYSLDLDLAPAYMPALIYSQCYGYWDNYIKVFDLYVSNGEITGFHAETPADTSYSNLYGFTITYTFDGTFTATGTDLYSGVEVMTGEEITELESAFDTLAAGNYTCEELVYLYDSSSYEYELYSTSSLLSNGTSISSDTDSSYISLPDFDISSILFSASSSGSYYIDVEGSFYMNTYSFDPFTSMADVLDDLEIDVGDDSIAFTGYDNVYGLKFVVTYTNIGSTVISE